MLIYINFKCLEQNLERGKCWINANVCYFCFLAAHPPSSPAGSILEMRRWMKALVGRRPREEGVGGSSRTHPSADSPINKHINTLSAPPAQIHTRTAGDQATHPETSPWPRPRSQAAPAFFSGSHSDSPRSGLRASQPASPLL